LKKFSSICFFLFFSLALIKINFAESKAPLKDRKKNVKEAFQASLTEFISVKGFSKAVISVYQEDQKLVDECFGACTNEPRVYPIASISKLLTEAAIHHLVSQGKLSLQTKVMDFLKLSYQPLDKRVNQITVEQLLNHTGGWDRQISSDPLFCLDLLPKELNCSEKFMKYVLTTLALDHDPGAEESYSNFGYFLLGSIVEKASGQSFLSYINQHLAEPNQVHFYQAHLTQKQVAEQPLLNYFNLELSTASFGLAANLSELCYLFTKIDRHGELKTTSSSFAHSTQKDSWSKDGSLPATTTSLIKHFPNNIVIAVYIPSRNEQSWEEDNEELVELMDQTVEKLWAV